MPSIRGITIHLQSQFDALTLPEYISSVPPPAAPSPLLHHHGRGLSGYDGSPVSDDCFKSYERSTDCLEVPEDRIADVYVPVYPLSQFWIGYEVDPREIMAVTADEGTSGLLERYEVNEGDEVKFVYFKLLVNGQQTVNWGIRTRRGRDEEEILCKGKVMFALFQRREQQVKAYEKRGFFFQGGVGDDEDDEVDCKEEEGVIEVRVYRARGRRRVGRKGRVSVSYTHLTLPTKRIV